MATDSKGRNHANAADTAVATPLRRGADELAALTDRITAGINAMRRALGKPVDWAPEPQPVPIPVPAEPDRRGPARRTARLAVSQIGGESLADIDRRLNERINALRAFQGKRPDWQPSAARADEPAGAVPARRRCGT